MGFSQEIKQSIGGDEYYSPQNVVDMILPYIKERGFKKIWCPFDTSESLFVQTFQREPQGEVVVSNPPFSKRDGIFERLCDLDVPFALVMNFNGLFDSKRRARLFKSHGVELIVPFGRMKFIHEGEATANHPNFQSVYVCRGILDSRNKIEFSGDEF